MDAIIWNMEQELCDACGATLGYYGECPNCGLDGFDPEGEMDPRYDDSGDYDERAYFAGEYDEEWGYMAQSAPLAATDS